MQTQDDEARKKVPTYKLEAGPSMFASTPPGRFWKQHCAFIPHPAGDAGPGSAQRRLRSMCSWLASDSVPGCTAPCALYHPNRHTQKDRAPTRSASNVLF